MCTIPFYCIPQKADSSDEESLHIDTEVKPEVKGRNSKVKKKTGILDLLQASKAVGVDYNANRYTIGPAHTPA